MLYFRIPFKKQVFKKSRGRSSSAVSFFRKCRIEPLEERAMLTTTLYLDFGAGIGFDATGNQNTLSTTVQAFRNIDGAGINGDGTGPDLQGRGAGGGMLATSSLNFQPPGATAGLPSSDAGINALPFSLSEKYLAA